MPAITPTISALTSRLRRFIAARPWLATALRVALWTAALLYFGFALLILSLRYLVLPQIENYRSDIEQAISQAIDRPVTIRAIDAYWVGLRPALDLHGLAIRDSQGQTALGFDDVAAELAWSSLWHLELRLARLELDAPRLMLRRDREGRYFAAGLEITPQQETDTGFADWLLAQDRIVIRNASITWQDELRAAPPLELTRLNFQLDNRGSRHRFGLSAEPPRQLAARLDIRADFKGRDIDQLEAWKGEVYAELDYADLAGWRAWIDYPVALPQGSGGLRLWLGFAQKRLVSATADVRLADVRLQLAPDLPELDLIRLDGRIAGRRLDGGIETELRHLTLTTRDGITLPPTDAKLAWQDAAANRLPQGRASANGLDLALLAKLAAHLPLDATSRERLRRHAPQGRVFDLALDWKGPPDALQQWSVKGRFDDLGLLALGPVPGIAGLSGRIDGNNKGGKLNFTGRQARFELPDVFAEPRLDLEAFAADLDWKTASDGLHINLQKARFENRDAAGEASGSWHALPSGPGKIDLSARLTRGSGDAVWRYMPLAVGKDARDWLRTGIVGGSASDATLTLRGDLSQFPFRDDKGGRFEVRGKFSNASLRYAPDWPEITGIDGELLFEGVRMLITGKSGRIFGVNLRDVKAEIADLEVMEELLTVTGKASGPTADFLRFIEASPVGERINHFTEDMQADGNGELDLALTLPLRRLANSTVAGHYRFDGNRLTVDADLPPLTEVRGSLAFTADGLDAKGIRGALLGSPLNVDVKTIGDGNVLINAAGEIGIAALRKHYPHALFEHLSGSAPWTGTVRIRKKTAEVRLVSNLLGLSSSLPEPFNKSATEALPFSFERKTVPLAAPAAKVGAGVTAPPPPSARTAAMTPVPRDMLDISLGRIARVQLVRRQDTRPATVTHGLVTVGGVGAPPLPERHLLLAVALPRVDADFWRELFAGDNGAASGKDAAAPRPPLLFDLKVAELGVFGKSFHEVRINGGQANAAATTRFDLKSRELSGSFDWHGAGSGKLSGRIGQFAIPETAAAPEVLHEVLTEKAPRISEQFPALDITVDQLSFKNRPLGTVRIGANNSDGDWTTRIDVKNEDGTLELNGRWRPVASPQITQVDFKLAAKNIEKLLVRFGYPDAVRRGNADLGGQLRWNGAPYRIDYPSLHGTLKLDAAGGQFNKLEPGVGRLLGILSLQSLPRRITLDFRDIFSEGFAFDSISGQFVVARGVMDTRDLSIQGPAAKVLMTGSVDLGNETQNLRVNVQPSLGESIATGVLLANPITGAATWVVNKLLGNPLDRAFAFEYAVTGNWADPKVDKVTQGQKQSAEEKK